MALAIFLVGISKPHSNRVYDDAAHEIESLQGGIEAVADQVAQVYKALYDKSDLKLGALEWLERHNAQHRDLYIEVVNPEEFVVPDSNVDPLVTLDAQLKWANRIYRELGSPFFLCQVDRRQLNRALDKTLGSSRNPNIEKFTVYTSSAKPASVANQHWSCAIDLSYEVREGTVVGIKSAILDIASSVVDIVQVEPPGPKWINLSLADTFKGHELGDWEDDQAIPVPSVWQLWSDLGARSPAAAQAFLRQKKEEESEKSKEKLDILGQSLSRSLTIVIGCIVELCLMIYLLAYVCHIRMMASYHQTVISESAFYGVMRTGIGRVMMLLSSLIPFVVCSFALMIVFPSLLREWPGPPWIANWITRLLLVICIGVADLFLILQTRGTLALLGPGTAAEKPQEFIAGSTQLRN